MDRLVLGSVVPLLAAAIYLENTLWQGMMPVAHEHLSCSLDNTGAQNSDQKQFDVSEHSPLYSVVLRGIERMTICQISHWLEDLVLCFEATAD
jgi:hypothetical protein